jgi:SAM-dependent methyltransferase
MHTRKRMNLNQERIQNCPLCQSIGAPFHGRELYLCSRCCGIFRLPAFWLSPAAEKMRYETHNNDVNDPRYQQFVSPITTAVLERYTPLSTGLDFGAGTGPVITKVLRDHGYDIREYDPFFCNHRQVLEETYDYIVCCEVLEHFHDPAKEFELLRRLLKKNGNVLCMTLLYDNNIDFGTWYYKNDPTHVFFYQRATLTWIQSVFGFSSVHLEGRLIRFQA